MKWFPYFIPWPNCAHSLMIQTSHSAPHLPMPRHSCIYCGRWIERHIKGRPATVEQLEQATVYHRPQPLTDTWICDEHRKRPPIFTLRKRSEVPLLILMSPLIPMSHQSDNKLPKSSHPSHNLMINHPFILFLWSRMICSLNQQQHQFQHHHRGP